MLEKRVAQNAPAETVLILAPTGQDAKLISTVLTDKGVSAEIFIDMQGLCNRLETESGMIVLAEEALSPAAIELLSQALKKQEVWSDIPIMVMTTSSTNTVNTLRILHDFGTVGNISLLERPLRSITLERAVLGALRARARQYQVRELLRSQLEATRAREEFISIASHELRTPLTSLKLMTQLNQRKLIKNPAGLTVENMARLIEVTENQVGRLTRLVEDMLDISRIGAGKLILRKSPVNFADLVNQSIDRMSEQMSAVKCEIKTNIPSSFPLSIDQDRVEQVVTNLLTNVIRYAPESSVQITLKKNNENAELIVADTGPGIPLDRQEKIFDRFERATASNNISGLGLGLYICKQIILAHEGTIRVESVFGQGTKFIVELPLIEASVV